MVSSSHWLGSEALNRNVYRARAFAPSEIGYFGAQGQEGSSMRSAETAANEVTVVFRNAALMFDLPSGSTLEDLARRLEDLGERPFGEPVYIDIKVRH